jgi:hypothetical protein
MVKINQDRSDSWNQRALEGIVNLDDIKDPRNLETWPVQKDDIRYLLDRFGWLIFWNADDLSPPGELQPIELDNSSPHYLIYDRGSCLVATPAELFSDERAHHDCLNTACAMIDETARREWTVQMAGPASALRIAWMHAQFIPDNQMQFLGFSPDATLIRLYHRLQREHQERLIKQAGPTSEGG